jgi:multiple sugar transport system substrate-binding protein
MERRTLAIAALVAFALVSGAGIMAADKVVINALFMKQAGYSEEDTTAATRDFESRNPNIHVELSFVPYEELEQKIITSASSGGYDVVLSDGPFTAKLAKGGIVKTVPDLAAADKADIFPGALDACVYNGKLYGMPWLNDCKYLFYNKSMLEKAGFKAPPATWDELLKMGKAMKDKGIVQYPIVWSWSQAECLICDYTTILASFGGSMVDPSGRPTLNSAANKKALQFMVDSIKAGITNPKSTEYIEDNVRDAFDAGTAAFVLNWTYNYAAAKDPSGSKVVDDVVIGTIPGSGAVKSATVNGGQPLAITAGSKHPYEAWTYILYLTGKDFQKKYVQNALPIWKSLYDDPEVVKSNPEVVKAAKVQYAYIVNRPKVPYYSALSSMLQVKIQEALLGKKGVDQALKEAQAEAEALAAKK